MTSFTSLPTGHYPALMLVGGDAFQGLDDEQPYIGPSNSAIMLLPHSAEYCSSDVGPIKEDTTGNVGKTC